MRCPRENKGEADLLAFSVERLEPEDAARIEEHLKTCSGCREFVEEQRAVWQALDGWEAPAVSADFDQRLFQRLEQDTGRWNRWMAAFRIILARQGLPIAAAACLIVVAGVVSLRSPQVAPPAQPQSIRVENLQPQQVEDAVDDLQMLSDFTRATRADADEL